VRFKSIFVTGTDTGVGKTTVSAGIAASLSQRGWRVGVYKPVETGCESDPIRGRSASDALRLQFFSGCAADLSTICSYALREPLAPLVAAEREAVSIDIDRLARCYEAIALEHDVTLIEGAGGLLVPLTASLTFADLAKRLDVPVLVVVGSRLGAINHALLTVRYAERIGLRVLGYVVNFFRAESDDAARSNVNVLTRLLGPALGVVPYLGEISASDETRRQLAEVFSARVRLDDLLVPC
jgi:dethiobiotin synthetase